ncbi:MAG TPA: HEPN domain-containing protein, partial [Gemmataceae bacterium]|nr:HEPN domain-containing protein [Gemmataceae bacterium]
MLVTLPMFKHWFPEALKKWFENSSTLRDVYDLFFSSLYSPGIYIQSEFLSLVQALESFSRTRGGADLYVPEDVYKVVREQLLAAIPGGIDERLRASLEGHIHFGNQHSLKLRIEAILGTLEDDTLKL